MENKSISHPKIVVKVVVKVCLIQKSANGQLDSFVFYFFLEIRCTLNNVLTT